MNLNKEKIQAPDGMDMTIFKRIDSEIRNNRLFLKPKLSRKDIMNIAYIPKNKFAALFVNCAGQSYTSYINSLRLEYACNILSFHPEYTIEGVAKECGIPVVQTFYRLFSNKYGMTPTAFRKSKKQE
jgi:AraC-like DNA-binding protein